MRYWLLTLLMAFAPLQGLQRIAHRNQYAREAARAYQQKNFLEAAHLYERVRQAEGNSVPATSVQVNLAHAYFQLHDYSRASPLYRSLLKNPNPHLQSMAATQLSVIEAEEGNFAKALDYSKLAMTTNETNAAARYNYELLQKYLLLHPEKRNLPPPPARKQEEQKGPGSTQKRRGAGTSSAPGAGNQPAGAAGSGTAVGGAAPSPNANAAAQKQNAGQDPGQERGHSTKDNAAPQGEAGNRQGDQPGQAGDTQLQTRFERLKKMNLSPEKARQLLDAMRQEETQYLQQLPRKKTARPKDNRPDW